MSKYNERIEENIKKYSKLNDLGLFLMVILDPEKYGINSEIHKRLLENSDKLQSMELRLVGNVSTIEKIFPYYYVLTIVVFIQERKQLPDTFTSDEKSLFALESMKEITNDIAMARFATKSHKSGNTKGSGKQTKKNQIKLKDVKSELEDIANGLPEEWNISKEIIEELKNQAQRHIKKELELQGRMLRINGNIVAVQLVRLTFCTARNIKEARSINGEDAKNKFALDVTIHAVDESISQMEKMLFP